MLDRNSVVVAYDYVRGENRSKYRKGEDREAVGKGDCIDCGVCVDVCPTGIDIRNGTQLECVNCTACIDGCNDIMDKIGKPHGLIRYASEASIADKKPWKMTTRTIAYSVVLSLMVVVLTAFLLNRTPVEATILRVPGRLYQKTEDGRIFNLYNFKLINKTQHEMNLTLKLISHEGEVELVGYKDGLRLEKSSRIEGTLFLYLQPSQLDGDNTKVRFGIYDGEKLIEKFSTNFNGPIR
jgi:cytochrome c oxidase accessory protein FixG